MNFFKKKASRKEREARAEVHGRSVLVTEALRAALDELDEQPLAAALVVVVGDRLYVHQVGPATVLLEAFPRCVEVVRGQALSSVVFPPPPPKAKAPEESEDDSKPTTGLSSVPKPDKSAPPVAVANA